MFFNLYNLTKDKLTIQIKTQDGLRISFVELFPNKPLKIFFTQITNDLNRLIALNKVSLEALYEQKKELIVEKLDETPLVVEEETKPKRTKKLKNKKETKN